MLIWSFMNFLFFFCLYSGPLTRNPSFVPACPHHTWCILRGTTHTSIARPYGLVWIGFGMCWIMINDDEDILKHFIAFNIMACGPIFMAVVVSQIMAHPTTPSHNYAFANWTYVLGFDSIFRNMSYVTLFQNQLIMRKKNSNFL